MTIGNYDKEPEDCSVPYCTNPFDNDITHKAAHFHGCGIALFCEKHCAEMEKMGVKLITLQQAHDILSGKAEKDRKEAERLKKEREEQLEYMRSFIGR